MKVKANKVKKGNSLDTNWRALKKILDQDKSRDEKKMKKKSKSVKEDSDLKQKRVMGILFDVDEDLPNGAQLESQNLEDKLVKGKSYAGLTKYIAMDCEMVGVGEGGKKSVLARCSIVNSNGHCVYDTFVKAREEVTDYRTWVSGVRKEDLESPEAKTFEVCQQEVSDLMNGRVLVGHALSNDLNVLFLSHPKVDTRDTSKYNKFKELCGGRRPALRILCKKLLGVNPQKGEHSSVTDAQATMRLYMMYKQEWEKQLVPPRLKKVTKKKKKIGQIKK